MLRLALRNIFRQWLRTGLTLLAIATGVTGLILSGGFVEDVYLAAWRSDDPLAARAFASSQRRLPERRGARTRTSS
jgi:hypothetical protein